MKKCIYILLLCFCIAIGARYVFFSLVTKNLEIKNYTDISSPANITPDYSNTVIPPNIAPLNFIIQEPGTQYFVNIRSEQGNEIKVLSKKSKIIIPQKKWSKLLKQNSGSELIFDIYIKNNDDKWDRYPSIKNTIAKESIDPYLVYRFMTPSSYHPKKMNIHQRNLENYDETIVLDSQSYGDGCVNCHTFVNNKPDKMLLGVRSLKYGSATLYVENGKATKLGTKIGYTSWHPSGKLATYSINKVTQFFHRARTETHEVLDYDSGILYYMADNSEVRKSIHLMDKRQLETYPSWSPDGKYLYYSQAPMLWPDPKHVNVDIYYEHIKYSLMRISYDIDNDQWGQPETVLSSKDAGGRSILLPRISPDGRFLLFCMAEYGCFPVYQPSSDLYMMDMQTGKYEKLNINSNFSESWHSWSSNSRWIAFSSKRKGGVLTRLFLSYIDESGRAYKAFIFPQKDPAYYDSLVKVYSVPELITGPVQVSRRDLRRATLSSEKVQIDLPITGATPKLQDPGPWRQPTFE